MGKCEHGLTTKECYVCASPKYGAPPACSQCGGSGFVYLGRGKLPPMRCKCASVPKPDATERACFQAQEAAKDLAQRLDRAECNLAKAVALLREAREWVNQGRHLPEGWEDECHVCQRLARIDAVLDGMA